MLSHLQPQQVVLNKTLDIRYYDGTDEMVFLDSCISGTHRINILNKAVNNLSDVQNIPTFEFAAATINLQTLTEPCHGGKGRRLTDLEASQPTGVHRSVSRLAGLRHITSSTDFGKRPDVLWLFQETKCMSSTSVVKEPGSGKMMGVVSHYNSSSPKTTRHVVLPVNNPLNQSLQPSQHAYTIWDQVVNTLQLMNSCKGNLMVIGGSFYLHWLPLPSHRHRGCVDAFKTLSAIMGYFILNMKGTKTESIKETVLDYIVVNCSGDFFLQTVESLEDVMDDPDHRLVVLQANLRLDQPHFDEVSHHTQLPDAQKARALRFLEYMKGKVDVARRPSLTWSGAVQHFKMSAITESVKKMDSVILLLVLIWLKVIPP